jgi:hypothetical protein
MMSHKVIVQPYEKTGMIQRMTKAGNSKERQGENVKQN